DASFGAARRALEQSHYRNSRHRVSAAVFMSCTRVSPGELMSYIMVDVEADGPIPGDYSMICLGAIVVEPSLSKTFYGRLRPVSSEWIVEALSVSGFSREQTLEFDEPVEVMQRFADWLAEVSRGRPIFVSDNNGFDWQFVNWY